MEYELYKGTKLVASFSTNIILDILNLISKSSIYNYLIIIECHPNERYCLTLSVYNAENDGEIIMININRKKIKNFKCSKYYEFFMSADDFENMKKYLDTTNKITISSRSNQTVFKLHNDKKYERIVFDDDFSYDPDITDVENMNCFTISTYVFNNFVRNDFAIAFNRNDILLQTPFLTGFLVNDDIPSEITSVTINNCGSDKNADKTYVKYFIDRTLSHYIALSKKYKPKKIYIYVNNGDPIIKFKTSSIGSIYIRGCYFDEGESDFMDSLTSSYGSKIKEKNINEIVDVLTKCSITEIHAIFNDAYEYNRIDIGRHILNNYREFFDPKFCEFMYGIENYDSKSNCVTKWIKKITQSKTKSARKN